MKIIKIIIKIIIIIIILYYLYNNIILSKLSRNIAQKIDQDIYILPNFLNNNSFKIIKKKIINYDKYKMSNNFMRKANGISNINMRKDKETNIILNLLDTPEILYNIYKKTKLNLQFVPKTDINYISIIAYKNPGDFINWHKDNNIYYGNRWAGILTIINKGNNNKKSYGNFVYKKNNKEIKINASENTLVLFRGDKIEHKTENIRKGDKRIIISFLFCDVCYPKTDIISLIYQKLVDNVFY